MDAFYARHLQLARWAARLAALAAIFAASAAAPSGAAPEFSQPHGAPSGRTIAILDLQTEIHFGKEIAVSARLDAGNLDVTEVRAILHTSGPSPIASYTYARFQTDPTLSAEFTIPTGGARYYPPGVEFEVHFELTDAQGEKYDTNRFTVEYLDPEIDWRRVTRGPLTAIYHGLRDAVAQDLVEYALARLPDLTDTVGIANPPTIKAVLFNSVSEASPYFPRVSQTATDRQFFAGFAMPEYGLFIIAAPSREIFVHEMTHLVIAEALQSPVGHGAPSWLDEGLAVYFQNDGDTSPLRAHVSRAARRGQLIPIRNMNRMPGQRDDVSLFYPQSAHVVAYLIDEYGRQRIARLLAALDSGLEITKAFQSAYGKPLHQVENEWRASAGAQPLPTPAPSADRKPGPLPTQLPLLPPPVDTAPGTPTEYAAPPLLPPPVDTAPPPQDAHSLEIESLLPPPMDTAVGTPTEYAAPPDSTASAQPLHTKPTPNPVPTSNTAAHTTQAETPEKTPAHTTQAETAEETAGTPAALWAAAALTGCLLIATTTIAAKWKTRRTAPRTENSGTA